MKLKFFKVPTHGGDVEDELNAFLGAHRIESLDRQFVADGCQSHWAVCVRYLDGPAPALRSRKGKVDYPEVLSAIGLWGSGHKGTNRVLRGGSWNDNAQNCRSANRNNDEPAERNDNIGFRFARARDRARRPVLTRPLSCPGPLGHRRKQNGPACASSQPEACERSRSARTLWRRG